MKDTKYAFPREGRDQFGMTLCDYFAAAALQRMLGDPTMHPEITESELAALSYKQADAMLEEKNRR